MQSLSGSLAAIIDLAGGEEERLSRIVSSCYNGLAGAMAERLAFESFGNGELVLIAGEKSWLDEARNGQEEIRSKLNFALGRKIVRNIRIRFRPEGMPKSRGTRTEAKRPLKPFPSELTEAAEAIKDDRARQAFLSLAATIAGRRDSGR